MEEKKSGSVSFYQKYKEYINYSIFGCSTALLSWLIYGICESRLGLSLRVAGLVSWIVAVIIAFVTNKLYVFESKSWQPELVFKELVTFVGGRVLTGALEIEAVPRLVDWGFNMTLFGVKGLPAKIVVTGIIVVLNYATSKFISFTPGSERKKPSCNESSSSDTV